MFSTFKPNICRACLAQHKAFNVRFTNHYAVLGVSRSATQKQIKEAYLELCKKEHPDQNKDKKSHERFVKISEAYSVLGKKLSRQEYDLTLDRHHDYPKDSAFRPGPGRPPPGAYERYPGQHQMDAEDIPNRHENPYEDDPYVRVNAEYFRSRRQTSPYSTFDSSSRSSMNSIQGSKKVLIYCALLSLMLLPILKVITAFFAYNKRHLSNKKFRQSKKEAHE